MTNEENQPVEATSEFNDRLGAAVTIILPECSDDPVSDWLRGLTREICLKTGEESGYGLGGQYGYGENFENDVFMMHRYCWCEREDCKWCNGDAPNFLHKPTGSTVTWYKYIGRGMEFGEADWSTIFKECFLSLHHA